MTGVGVLGAGRIGRLHAQLLARRIPGASLAGDFDMARFVTGSEVVEVYARSAVRAEPAFEDVGDVAADGWSGSTLPSFFLDRYVPSYVREWEAFLGAVRAGEAPPVGAADGRAPLVIGLAAWRSLREGRPVRIEEVPA
jgi:myo-inositol 2-dehydrogenase / D-chiro-inositol 1-dehydrogenase